MPTKENIYHTKLSNAIAKCGTDEEFAKLDKLIKEDKVCVSIKNVIGLTALHECVYAPHDLFAQKIMSSLISSGADINACDSGGASVLHHTVNRGRISLLKILLKQKNINVNISSPLGSTALMLCIDRSRDYHFMKFNQSMAQELKQKHIQTKLQHNDMGMIMAELLIKAGADYKILKNSDKKTAEDLTKASPTLFKAYEALLIDIEKSMISASIPLHKISAPPASANKI